MTLTATEFQELVEMRENIRRNISSLELCWNCQKISECRQWLVNEIVPVWLCDSCVDEVTDLVNQTADSLTGGTNDGR